MEVMGAPHVFYWFVVHALEAYATFLFMWVFYLYHFSRQRFARFEWLKHLVEATFFFRVSAFILQAS